MTWGKIAITAATVLLLTGCSAAAPQDSSPTAEPSPSATSTLQVKNFTGDPVANRLFSILEASCQHGKDAGLAVYVPQEAETLYTFAQPDEWSYWQAWNMMTVGKNGSGVGGWPDGDRVCAEWMFVSRPLEQSGKLKYELEKIDEDTFDLSIGRPSEMGTARITVANDLVKTIETKDFTFEASYGPFPKEIMDLYQETLVEAGWQYHYLTPAMWGMTLDEAKAYAKKHGLTVVVGIQDSETFEIEGPSDRKRLIVNLGGGEIVGVWTE